MKIVAYKKLYYETHKEEEKANCKAWCGSHNELHREYQNAYRKNRKETDPLYKLRLRLSSLIGVSLRHKGYSKASKTQALLGADFVTVQTHLVQTAIKNYGSYNPSFSYYIDHIIPCSSATTEEELIKLQHYTNLQYLTPEDNLKKSDKI